jgi:hypothetical protein
MSGLGFAAAVLFIIATILAWLGHAHSDAFAYAGLACLALQVALPYTRWGRGRAVP